jgi:hypothetical protein
MKMLQVFESTIFSDTTDHAVHLLVAPSRSFVSPKDLESPEGLLSDLNLVRVGPVSPANLAFALAALVSVGENENESAERLFEFLRTPTVAASQTTQRSPDVVFAEEITFSQMIPFEQSPIDLKSLGALVTKATGVGLGAYAGFVQFDGTPLLFVAVPAGMILFGAAAGVGRALEEGLRERVLKILRGKKPAAGRDKMIPSKKPVKED